jgi:predicted nucleic acid-binding protein
LIVVDASVVATALADDTDVGRRVRTRLAGEALYAPELIDLEVASAVRRLLAAQKLIPERATAAITDLRAMEMRRVPHRPLLARCWDLRDNATICDAAYIALAEALRAPLLTADQRLANAPGADCTFEIIG